MKSIKSLALTGLASLLLVGCGTTHNFTESDIGRIKPKKLEAIGKPSGSAMIDRKDNLSHEIPYLEKEKMLKAYPRIPKYVGDLLIIADSKTKTPLVQDRLDTTGPLNEGLGNIKALEGIIPNNSSAYRLELGNPSQSSSSAKDHQLSTETGLLAIDYFAPNQTLSKLNVNVHQTPKAKGIKEGKEYTVVLTFGEPNTTLTHKRANYGTGAKLAEGAAIGSIAWPIGTAIVPLSYGVEQARGFASGFNLPEGTSSIDNVRNAGVLEEKISRTISVLNEASRVKADRITAVNLGKDGTAVVYTFGAKAILTGIDTGNINDYTGLQPNQISFTTTRTGANHLWHIFTSGVQAGVIKAFNPNQENTITYNFPTGTGTRIGAPGGTGTGGRIGGPGGSP